MPDWKKEIEAAIAPLNLSAAREAEVVEELSQHLNDRYEELLVSGVGKGEADRTLKQNLLDGKLIEAQSGRVLKCNVASFYPLLYRLEEQGLIEGRWIEKVGQRRRRYYKLTAKGKKMLETQHSTLTDLGNAIRLITEAENA